ncbi:aldo/keto reductase [Streptomyces sp. NPDC058067]|uniref:aldo/keto reductase n=1 Tax=Streptomyces sp. NPDC058067 TaxID=3346324 RepID=UPI0036E70A79
MAGVAGTRALGDLEVFPIGLGAMTLTQVMGYDEKRGIRTVHAALDAGVTLIDTADVYGPAGGYGVNELAVVKALALYPGSTDHVIVSTKGGHLRNPDNTWWIDGRPAHLRSACEDSLRRLGYDALPLYYHHRPDPQIPYAESMGGMRDLYDAGLIRRAGISNADPEQIRLAREILGDALVSVQNEFSPRFRSSQPEIDLCAELGLAFSSWSPLGGMREAKELGSAHGEFHAIAEERGVSPQRVALAWQLMKSPVIIPIPGASRPESVLDSVRSVEFRLSAEEFDRLERSV